MITVETIRERHSVREYDGKPLSRAEFDALGAVVEEYARESGLDIQLVGDNPEVFNVIARFGLIRGCRTHVAFVVDDGKARGVAADEAIGARKSCLPRKIWGSIRAGVRCARAGNRALLWCRGRKFAWSLRWATGKHKAFHGRRRASRRFLPSNARRRRRGLRRPWKPRSWHLRR